VPAVGSSEVLSAAVVEASVSVAVESVAVPSGFSIPQARRADANRRVKQRER
jgi:hypothetical protein